eukprot:scaffold4510_cov183-Amphora_coffeaeformis.AAC.10
MDPRDPPTTFVCLFHCDSYESTTLLVLYSFVESLRLNSQQRERTPSPVESKRINKESLSFSTKYHEPLQQQHERRARLHDQVSVRRQPRNHLACLHVNNKNVRRVAGRKLNTYSYDAPTEFQQQEMLSKRRDTPPYPPRSKELARAASKLTTRALHTKPTE